MKIKYSFGAVAVAVLSLFIGRCVEGPVERDPVDTPHVIELDTNNFNRLVLDTGTTAMVDFYSPGCHLCMATAWMVDSLAVEFGDAALIGKVDIYANEADTLWKFYGITALPTFIFFQHGAEVTRRTYYQLQGAGAEYDSLVAILQGLLAGQ
jgi:thioredoxin-like negative regulator of GroEL